LEVDKRLWKQMLDNVNRAFDWEGKLKSANDLFHQGSDKFGNAAQDYSKIFEFLLRFLYKELIMVIPHQDKEKVIETEKKISKGMPAGKLGLGKLIALFSESNLFGSVNKALRSTLFDSRRLNEINEFRIDQTHYVYEAELKNQVDDIRKYTTEVLLKLNLIRNDPDEAIQFTVVQKPDIQKRIQENQLRKLRKIRLGLASGDKTIVEEWYEVFKNEWSSYIEIKAEIVGLYLEHDTFVVLVRVIHAYMPEDFYASDEEENAYNRIRSKVLGIIEEIDPEIEPNLKILVFNEWSEVEKIAFEFSEN